MGRGQAKAEAGPGLRAGDEGSDLRQPEGGQAMTRLSTGTSLGLARRPDQTPGVGGMNNPPGGASRPQEKSIFLDQEVTVCQPGETADTGNSRTRKETLAGQGQTIPPPAPAMMDILHLGGGSPHHTAVAGSKKGPEVNVESGLRSDHSDPSTDITDKYISTN